MFSPTACSNSRPGGFGVLEILAEPKARSGRQFVPLRRTSVDGEVIGPLAAIKVTHIYGFTRDQCERVVEAFYRFPLPGDAAVTGTTVTFGDVEIRAEIRERPEAEAEYERARAEGRQAALVARESPDVFTLKVAGIKPDEEITIETSYVQLASVQGGGWSLRVPLTTAPRYVRSDEVGFAHAQGQPLAVLRDPGHLFSVDLLLPGAMQIESPTHGLDVADEDGRPRVRLAARRVVPDRDFVLTWRAEQRERQLHLRVLTHEERVSNQLYFLALVAPPVCPVPDSAVAREVTLLVDRSGSMVGPKWAAADWAVKKFLGGLTERDSFALGLFHDDTRWFSPGPTRADAAAIAKARRFLDAHRDSGGTELGVALEQALSQRTGEGARSRHVLVITDAEVSDAGRILRLAEEESRFPNRRRISVLCIDSAPNSYLARELALRGGGVAHFLTSNPREEDITTALDEILADWAQPLLANLRLEVDAEEVEVTGRGVLAPGAVDLGDLPAGRAIWVAGRVRREGERMPGFSVIADAEPLAEAVGEPAGRLGGCPALKALFGVGRVNGLEKLLASGRSGEDLEDGLARLGYDPARELAEADGGRARVYHENVRLDARADLERLLARESLNYGLLSSVTAFVATRSERGKPVEESVVVANALPYGWSSDFLTATPTAPGAPTGGGVFFHSIDSGLGLLDPSGPLYNLKERLAEGSPMPLSRRTWDLLGAAPGRKKALPPVSFSGTPDFTEGEAVLLDTTVRDGRLFSRLRVRFRGGQNPTFAPSQWLLLYAEDMAVPVVRVRLADLVSQGGERPVNVYVRSGGRLRIVLRDESGEWAGALLEMEVVVE